MLYPLLNLIRNRPLLALAFAMAILPLVADACYSSFRLFQWTYVGQYSSMVVALNETFSDVWGPIRRYVEPALFFGGLVSANALLWYYEAREKRQAGR